MGHSFFAFIVVIGVLVFIHEFGHFLAARMCGVGVDVFSLGFGPKIFKRKMGRTEYCVSAIPLGGYVKMVGEEPGSTLAAEDKSISFTHKSLLKKSLIVAAGPVFNFLLAIFIFYMFFQVLGELYLEPVAKEVAPDSPALHAGIKPNDRVIEINKIKIDSFDQIKDIMAESKGEQVELVIQRDDQVIQLSLTPKAYPGKNVFGEDIDAYRIGIVSTNETFRKRYNPVQALSRSLDQTWFLSKLTIISFWKMITGKLSAKNLGGPIMIAQMAGKQVKAGIDQFLGLLAYLSISLGIINLFPIPVLDGGHLLFFAIEGATGKPVNESVREKLIQAGAAMLVALMVFVFYNDIVRTISGN